MNRTDAIDKLHCQSCLPKLTEPIQQVGVVDSAVATLDASQKTTSAFKTHYSLLIVRIGSGCGHESPQTY